MTLMFFMLAVMGMMAALMFQRLGWSLGRGKYLLWAIGIVLAYRLVLATHFFRADRSYCARTAQNLRRGLVRLKVAFLLHDNLGVNKILMGFMTANTRLRAIKSLSFVDYLGSRKAKKPVVPQKMPLPPKKKAKLEGKGAKKS